jgi:hypothetical protein
MCYSLVMLLVKRKYFLSCTGFILAVKLHWLDKSLLYTETDQDIAFHVEQQWETDSV